MRKSICLLVTVMPLASCAAYTPKDVVQPSDIKIENAMVDTARGLIMMRDTLKGQYKTGLFPDSAQITFNVTAGATDKSSLNLDIGAKTPGPTVVTADAKYGYEASSTSSRGNQIVVTFKNILTADLNDVGKYQQGVLKGSGGVVVPSPCLGAAPPKWCVEIMAKRFKGIKIERLQQLLKKVSPQ